MSDETRRARGWAETEINRVRTEKNREIERLKTRCEELARQTVDDGAVHLADETTIRQLEEKLAEAKDNSTAMLKESAALRGQVRNLTVLSWAGIDSAQQMSRLAQLCKGLLIVDPGEDRRNRALKTLDKAVMNWRGWDALARSAPFLPPRPEPPKKKG